MASAALTAALDYPAAYPPEGVVQNLVNPPSLIWYTVGLGYSFMIITLLFFGIRMYTAGYLLKRLQWDDYTCIIAVALYIPFNSLLIYVAYNHAGQHIWDMTFGQLFYILHYASIIENIYCMAHLFAKISILQQIRRIFSGTKKKGLVYVSCTVCLWANVLFYTATMAAHIGGCQPAEYEWNKFSSGKCNISIEVLIVVSSAVNVFTDLIIFVIPVYAVWRLVLPLRRKIAIGFIFATGAMSCVFSIVRLYYTVPLITTDDKMYQLNLSALWTIPEISTAILCGCMPSIPLFVRSLRSSSSDEPPTTSMSYGPDAWKKPPPNKAPPNTRRLHLSNWSRNSTQREKIPVEAPPVPKIDPELGLTSVISAVPRAVIRNSSQGTESTFIGGGSQSSPRTSSSGIPSKGWNPAITVTTTISQPMSPSQLALLASDEAGMRVSQRTMDTPITLHPDDGTLPPTTPSITSDIPPRDPFATPTETDRAMSVSPDHATTASSTARPAASPELVSPLISRAGSARVDATQRWRAGERAARLARGNPIEMEDTSVPPTRSGPSPELGMDMDMEKDKSQPRRSKSEPKRPMLETKPRKGSTAASDSLGGASERPLPNPVASSSAQPDDHIASEETVEDDAVTHSSSSAPPTPLAKRPPSLSERTTSPAGRQAMASLRGRFWRDSIDENRDAEERAQATFKTVQRIERSAREKRYERQEAEREARALRLMLH